MFSSFTIALRTIAFDTKKRIAKAVYLWETMFVVLFNFKRQETPPWRLISTWMSSHADRFARVRDTSFWETHKKLGRDVCKTNIHTDRT
jgi:hypothetical protein